MGTVLLQRNENGTGHVICYASWSLWPSEQSMWNYSSAKLVLALKWAVTEKLRDYPLGSKFTMYTGKYLLAYVKGSKLGVAQIWWPSELALFDFDIKYRAGKSSQSSNTLSHHPQTSNDNYSTSESEEYKTIAYAVVCNEPVQGD